MTIANVITKTVQLDGKTYNEQVNVNSDSANRREIPLAAAKTGTLTTRTDNDTGSLTMTAGHGITTGSGLDVYWNIGGVPGSRRNMTVGTVAGDVVPIDGGIGDNLPAAASAITAMVPVAKELRWDGDDMQILAITADAQATMVLTGDDNVEDFGVQIVTPNQLYEWHTGSGVTNPIATDVITKVFCSHGDSTGVRTLKIAVGYN